MFQGVGFIVLRVRDIDETIEFYTKVLGFYLLRKYTFVPDGPPAGYVGLDGVLLELFEDPEGASKEITSFGINVENLDAAMAHVRSQGVEITRENFDPHTFWGRQAGIVDPSGHRVSLREWHAPDSPTFADWQPKHAETTRLA